MNLAKNLMTQQYIGEIAGKRGRFRVYHSGDPKYLIFCPLDPCGCESDVRFPILKRELKKEIKQRLFGVKRKRPPKKPPETPVVEKLENKESAQMEVILVQVITQAQLEEARQKLEEARQQRHRACF